MGQDTIIEAREYRHAIGIGAGFTTGYGLSYRFFPARLGFQVNFAPYKTRDMERYSAGITFIYPVIPGSTTTIPVPGQSFFL